MYPETNEIATGNNVYKRLSIESPSRFKKIKATIKLPIKYIKLNVLISSFLIMSIPIIIGIK